LLLLLAKSSFLDGFGDVDGEVVLANFREITGHQQFAIQTSNTSQIFLIIILTLLLLLLLLLLRFLALSRM
jgi:hypothetical protein